MLPAQPNQSLINGLSCLQAIVTADRPLGSREVARLLGLEHTRVNRLLGTLCHLGMLERTTARKYAPGPGIHVLSAQSLRGSGLLAAAMPHLRELCDEKLVIAMGVLWDRSVCYLVHTGAGTDPDKGIGHHALYPANKSVIGIALLAGMTDTQVRKIFAGPEPALSKDGMKTLLGDLAIARKRGYAVKDVEDRHTSIAAVVGDPPVAAIALTAIRKRADVPRLAKRLLEIADRISSSL